MTRERSLTRQILSLAVPAFFALVAEPLFLLVDSAIVGHLGTPQLAALGVAGSVLATAAGVFVFLAYGTTASVARAMGAGAGDKVVAAGVDGTVLAVVLGALFVAEVTSVVVQILAFRTTGRRVFRMAPFHHHFELVGWAETTVIIRFWLLTAIACGLGVAPFYSEWLTTVGA